MTLKRKTVDDVTTVQRDLLKVIRTAGQRGLTDEEIRKELHLENVNSVRDRRAALQEAGLVKPLGVTRSINGKMEDVFVVTKEGRAVD